MNLKSPAFRNNHPIPRAYSQEGRNVSPPLEWSDVPSQTRELALTCEDPDAPGDEPFVHWMLYNISPATSFVPEGIQPQLRLELPIRADQGKTSSGEIGYIGPMPPIGHGVHHYVFRLYALDAEIGLRPGISDPEELLEAIEEHVIESAQLVGTYVRAGEQLKAG